MPPLAKNLGELKKSGWKSRSVKTELRENLLARMKSGEPLFPGILGYDKTVLPQIQNALLSRHDFILLGLRGQAKSRLLRLVANLLDEWLPVLDGTPLNEDPLSPISPKGKRILAEQGDSAPIHWLSREERFQEKLATPDVSISDLIGDIDPIKAAREKLDISNEEVIHWGIIPRMNRGIFAVNELPDLQPRIQVGLFNILEESDIQVRGFPLRLPLDMLLVFSANPEDYTNRGTIITPLKDRIASQIMTHYPNTVDEAMAITKSQIRRDSIPFPFPDWLYRAIEEISFQARASEFVDQTSGVSARVSIAAVENVISNVERRAVLGGVAYPRLVDLYAAIPAVTGKVELVHEGDQQGSVKVARLLIGQAISKVFLDHFPKPPKKGKEDPEKPSKPHAYTQLIEWFQDGEKIVVNDDMPAAEYRKSLDRAKPLRQLVAAHAKPADDAEAYLFMELVLEGLHAGGWLSRKEEGGVVEYLDIFSNMFRGLKG
ncbi:MAG: magnesium chelatase [Spirochaetes bacterium]|nr:magnesium chelatase [Spirochaetota bacterium]